MIERYEIITMANQLGLNPDTVEKDYVLNWLLWGIYQQPHFVNQWLFKGGTCLKKCFFETFRFSEDLDFTLLDEAHLSVDFLREQFNEITRLIYDETGIEFFQENFKFKVLSKDKGKLSAQGVIHYNGPLRRKQTPTPNFASIKLDLTNNEKVVLTPIEKRVHHPYSDEPGQGISATCYAFEEVIGEKIRALAERARPRDLYDVIHFFRNRSMIENIALLQDVIQQKCLFKKIAFPTYEIIQQHKKIEELSAQWHHMLAHQLPVLPSLDSFWEDLEPFFAWLENTLKTYDLPSYNAQLEEVSFQPGRIHRALAFDATLQKIQFAAANRLCIEFYYNNKLRLIEPLSFRKPSNGNALLYGYELVANTQQIKAFAISKIQDLQTTNASYMERDYPIEISISGKIVMPPIRRKNNR